jgi:hypothetical protein
MEQMMSISQEEFQQWGFRWPAVSFESLPDGRTVTIEPTSYLKSYESLVTQPGRKFLREYSVQSSDGTVVGPLNELQVERLLGEEPVITFPFLPATG